MLGKLILLFSLIIFTSNSVTSESIVNDVHLRTRFSLQETHKFNDMKKPYCTKQLMIECAINIQKTIVACTAAFQSGGTNIIADIKCAKYLFSDQKTCWPCICAQAQKKQWKIIGC